MAFGKPSQVGLKGVCVWEGKEMVAKPFGPRLTSLNIHFKCYKEILNAGFFDDNRLN